ncbi:hypothetical protein VSH64_11890 [Amycolatopsis rhabdoformis]|uniref:Cyclodeaminase/cyclohydrolase family protein n=1 Tax=Amycolatopsis rhabdoformis TaxID=1448059 RepID=A0ABZ1IEB6_9PSEU|nr:hypothetical protein [Amycolatopsis rhabdoformis]WSE32805.1 hypothetical protein VSH64_11890 [Amycolatopsis rhabdoformis]
MSEFLKFLATPAVGASVPAGGTVAALALAQAAALLARTGNGEIGSAVGDVSGGGAGSAGGGWMHGLRLAEQDAFAVRRDPALAEACRPAAAVIAAAGDLLTVAEQRLDEVRGGALLDVAAAAEAIRSAVVTARVAIESRTGAEVPVAAEVDGLAERAERITEAVRAGVAVV